MATFYNRGKFKIANAGWTTAADIRALVLTHASTLPAGANDPDLNFVSDLLGVSGVTEASGTGYARQALTSEAVIEDDTNNTANLDAADLSYSSTNSGRWVAVVLYLEGGGTDASRDLISLNDLASALTTNGGNVTLTVDTLGFIGLG